MEKTFVIQYMRKNEIYCIRLSDKKFYSHRGLTKILNLNIIDYEEKLKNAKTDEEKNTINNDIDRLKYAIDIYENKGIVYRNNFYFCPIGYNYEEEQILDKSDVDKINNSTSIPKNIYVRLRLNG